MSALSRLSRFIDSRLDLGSFFLPQIAVMPSSAEQAAALLEATRLNAARRDHLQGMYDRMVRERYPHGRPMVAGDLDAGHPFPQSPDGGPYFREMVEGDL